MVTSAAGCRLPAPVDGAVARSARADPRPTSERCPSASATLPIACVEGWSASRTWTGVPLRDLVAMAGADGSKGVTVVSLERPGLYSSSEVNHLQLADPDTLLALEVDGEPLSLDHGFPLRLIGPNRPGVLQTKWVTRVVVR